MTNEVYNYCAAVCDSKLYGVSYGVPELWKLGAFEFLTILAEFSQAVKGDSSNMPIWKKYYKPKNSNSQ